MTIPEKPEWAKDTIHTRVRAHLDWRDRLRVLFGRPLHIDVTTFCEVPPGKLLSESDVWAERVFPQRPRGGYAEVCEMHPAAPESVDAPLVTVQRSYQSALIDSGQCPNGCGPLVAQEVANGVAIEICRACNFVHGHSAVNVWQLQEGAAPSARTAYAGPNGTCLMLPGGVAINGRLQPAFPGDRTA